MKFIGFEREEKAESWAREKLGLERAPGFFRAMSAIDNAGDFVCVAVLTNFSAQNVDVNIVMESSKMRPVGTVEMYNGVFGFLFDGLMVSRVTGLSKASNKKAHKAIEKFGFKLEGVMRKAMPNNEDMMVYGFLPEEYHQHNWYRG